MTIKDLESLYDYSYWANARLFSVVSALTSEEFARPIAGSWGSVRNTLVHMMSAEGGWLERAGGPRRGPALDPDNFPTFESLTTYWQAQEVRVRAFLGSITDEDLARPKEFTIPQLSMTGVLTIGEMLHHAVNHNTHHRAQAALQIRELGYVPGNLDLLFYFGERREALT